MLQNEYQVSFFDYLYDRGGYKRIDHFAEEVAAALYISRSGAYKKIRAISKLSFDESMQVCKYFGISLDQYLDSFGMEKSSYAFQSDDIVKPLTSYLQWAKNILTHSESMDRYRDEYTVYSFSNEIPVFHILPFHHLLSFKLFIWNRNNWNISQYGLKYDFDHFDKDTELKSTLAEVNDHFISYESVDVWGSDFLTNTLNQLRYYTKIGAFRRQEDPLLILADIRKMINHLKSTAKAGAKMRFGSKEKHAKMDIYLNYTHTSPELIFIQSGKNRVIYSSYLSPNYLRTTDERICDYTNSWMEKAIAQSSLISKVGEVDRENVFNILNSILDDMEDKLRYYSR